MVVGEYGADGGVRLELDDVGFLGYQVFTRRDLYGLFISSAEFHIGFFFHRELLSVSIRCALHMQLISCRFTAIDRRSFKASSDPAASRHPTTTPP